jgi:aminoglycoside 6'-N-acetyltransferase I
MSSQTYIIRILKPEDASVLNKIAPDVFDNAIDPLLTAEFLNDSRHHLAVALDADLIVGMASALHYIHPDKPPELYINEVGVTPTHRNQGIGRQLLKALFAHGKTLGCTEAWLGTERSNNAARRMYAAAGGKEEQEETVIVWFDLNP